MSLRIEKYVNGKWRENCYVVANGAGEALIIDPGSRADDIAGIVERNGWRAKAILNTHGHYDHIGAVADLMDRFGLSFYMHGDDIDILRRANLLKLIFDSDQTVRIPKVTHDIRIQPSILEIGAYRVRWMATPGHTPGGVCFLIEDCLFSGDTLLRNAVGRTDLPGGNRADLIESLKKLTVLPGETEVFAGHGERTTMGAELAHNAKLKGIVA